MSGRSRANQVAGLLLAALWIAAPVAESVHASTHVHRYCAEHQTIEEVGEVSGSHQATASGLSQDAEAGESAHGHQACALTQVDSRRGVLELPSSWVVSLMPEPPQPAAALSPSYPSVPLLSLAPKLSPPNA